MSADNGIYILATPKGDTTEYRVSELGAIENLEWDAGLGDYSADPDLHITNARQMFSRAKLFHSEVEAMQYAAELYRSAYICEYGICPIRIDREF